MKTFVRIKIGVVGVLFLFYGASAAFGAHASTWMDSFDSYTNGQFLDGGADDGGWKGWDDNPSVGAYVTNTHFHSHPNSVDINGVSDLVHEYEGYTSGQVIYRCLQYIPADYSGESYFILLAEYHIGGSGNIWTVQLRFDSDLDVVESEFTGEQAPLVYDTWVEISCEIDLDTDWLQIWYNGTLLAQHAWTDTVQGTGGGTFNVAAVDLFANGATSVYYDDMVFPYWTPPVFVDAGGPYSGYVNENISFTGLASGGVEPYTWAWDFGDGATADVQNPTHAYSAAGDYTATLTVTDAEFNSLTDTASVTIFPAPPALKIGAISGGFGIRSYLKNTGAGAATNVTWSLTLDGTRVFIGRASNGTFTTIAPAGKEPIKAGFILGLGKTNIIVSVTCDEGVTAEATASGFILGPFILRVQ